MINGHPVDLGQLRAPSVSEQLHHMQAGLLSSAGIELGGRAELVTDLGVRVLDSVGLQLMVGPNGGLTIVGVCGTDGKTDDTPGRRTLIPWHSISRMGPA